MFGDLNHWLPSWQLQAEQDEANRLRKAASRVVDQDGLTTEEEDEIAAQLLSQFPPFGSHEQKDWLSLDDMFDNNNNDADQDNALSESMMLQQSALPGKDSTSPLVGQEEKEEWDKDEEFLWKRRPIAGSIQYPKENNMNSSMARARLSKVLGSVSEEKLDWIDRGRRNSQPKSVHRINRLPETPLDMRTQGKANPKVEGDMSPTKEMTTYSLQTSPSSDLDVDRLTHPENRQHWMPDQLCKQCYSCETQFTVFRRRHHCRICGQVFCNHCSAFFVPQKSGATVRVCQMCFEQVSQRGGLLEESNNAWPTGSPNEGVSAGAMIPMNLTDDTNEDGESPHDPSLRKLESVLQRISDRRLRDISSHGDDEGKVVDTIDHDIPSPSLPARGSSQLSSSSAANSASWIPFAGPSIATTPQNGQKLIPPPAPSSRSGSISGVADSLLEAEKAIQEGNRALGMAAAEHLEHLCRKMLMHHAPMLWAGFENRGPDAEASRKEWTNQLLTLATRCCATVEPNVRNGDLLDIRPYCKIKVVPGGRLADSAYLSGVMFRKTVSHKKMALEIENPKIMLLSGGIEFTRTENRIASLETLFEQEDKYTEILVTKILKLQPSLLIVGRSVSRRAQELLLKAGVTLIQQVKSNLLSRISRQTGATVISSTDHIMNQFGSNVLGTCRRFRLVTFRDNEVWVDTTSRPDPESSEKALKKKFIKDLLANTKLSNQERQAALAAQQLGEDVLDGAEAVKSGLAKRGVAQTYIMLEGSPKQLGCTIVLRGANRQALKQVKGVLRFLVLAAYNMRLETSYLKERRARLRPDFKELHCHGCSTSLCVNYGDPPIASSGRKIFPWNGGESSDTRANADEVTALDHGALLVTSIWMTEKSQCCPAEVKGICYYSLQDVSLGQFLRDSCFNLSLKCQNPNCKKSVLDHSLSFVHNDGLLNIVVEQLEDELPPHPTYRKPASTSNAGEDQQQQDPNAPIATWTYCRVCKKMVSPLTYISEDTWKFSFGMFLQSFFYNRDAILNAPDHGCSCQLQSSAILFFGCGKLSARFTYEPIKPFEVFVRTTLPMDVPFHREETLRRLDLVSASSSELFVKFDKLIERVSREARLLLTSAVARPEHLQTLLSELNRIGSDVDNASKTLQAKVASVYEECRRRDGEKVNDALIRFPWFARRFLYLVMSAWNDKLRAAGKAISAMKKMSASVSRADGGSEPYNDQLNSAIKRLRELNERFTTFNIDDMNEALGAIAGSDNLDDYDDDFEETEAPIDFSDEIDADVLASRRHRDKYASKPSSGTKHVNTPTKTLGSMRSSENGGSVDDPDDEPKATPGGAVKSAFSRFFNRGSRDENAYIVDLGIFKQGRPSLPPGIDSKVVPVFDEEWSSIIAYSLSSSEYAKQFNQFSKQTRSSSDGKPDSGVEASELSGEIPLHSDGVKMTDESTGQASIDGDQRNSLEKMLLVRNKTHIKHTFRDFDSKGQVTCKFVATTYWATQFHAVRQVFLSESAAKGDDSSSYGPDVEQSFIESLSATYSWAASGGKSGASFARSCDDRFVVKCISRTELQMFLDCAPAYFEYLTKAFFHGLPTVLCKILGVFQIGVHNRVTGKRSMEQVAVMQNIFYNRKITKIFDLKGSLRGRFAANIQSTKDQESQKQQPDTPLSDASTNNAPKDESGEKVADQSGEALEQPAEKKGPATLLDGDFLEMTLGRPMPMTDRAKVFFQMSILNDTLFLSIINVLDYSILVGLDESDTEKPELVVGIIDFFRQYDIMKQMERVGKSLPMVVGSEAPTIIQPPLYKARFTNAMDRYFMTVPSKWTTI